LSLVCIFCTLNLNAQTYLISFAGTGESTTVNTVKVDNLVTGISRSLNENQILRLNVVITDINSGKINQSSELKIYPNPMTDYSIMQVYPAVSGKAVITVSDISGRQMVQTNCYLDNYLQEFLLSGFPVGFYLITVSSPAYQYSGKLISNGKSNGAISIEKVSNNKQTVKEKISETDSKGEPDYIDMPYTPGDRLKYTSISGDYSTVIMDTPNSDKTVTFNLISCTDGDNNNYPVVEIGSQTWMAENLKTTKYNDGTAIPNITDNTAWEALTTGGYCDYNNSPSNSITYGRLYNWYAADNNAVTKVASNGGKNVCPTGWHVPIDADLTTLITYLGGTGLANGKLRETGTAHWAITDIGVTNLSGFTALPGGGRIKSEAFKEIGYFSYFWSATEYQSFSWFSWTMRLGYNNDVSMLTRFKTDGYSVRCLRDK